MRTQALVEARFSSDLNLGFTNWSFGVPGILRRLYKLLKYEHHDSAGAYRIPRHGL
jgi:hypothetical protein